MKIKVINGQSEDGKPITYSVEEQIKKGWIKLSK